MDIRGMAHAYSYAPQNREFGRYLRGIAKAVGINSAAARVNFSRNIYTNNRF